MPIVHTNLRNTRESARQIRFERGGGIVATDVQNAIIEGATSGTGISPTPVTAAQSPYQIINTDSLLWVDTSAGPVQIKLTNPALRNDKELTIKDISGNASTNNITLTDFPVDGLSPYTINMDFAAVKLWPNATNGTYAVGE